VDKLYATHGLVAVKKGKGKFKSDKLQVAHMIHSLALEVVMNRTKRRETLRESHLNEKNKLSKAERKQFQSRMDAFCNAGKFLFKYKNMAHIVVLMMLWFVNDIRAAIENLKMFWRKTFTFTEDQALMIHFQGRSSFFVTDLFFRAIKSVSGGKVLFPKLNSIRSTRDSKPIGEIKILERMNGNNIGRYWELMDQIPRVLENKTAI
jgi:hypothetical protein